MSVCSSCGAQIIWAITETGARNPIDPAPVEGGNIRLRVGGDALIYAKVQREMFDDNDDGTRYQSHFVTCPNAPSHRKNR